MHPAVDERVRRPVGVAVVLLHQIRKKDLIIRGGLNIVPSEIEQVIFAHDAVLEAAVVGIPDVEWGESILAVVALKEGKAVDPAALAEWCRTKGLQSLLVPFRFGFVDSLPQNLVGKIDKRALWETHGEPPRRSEAPPRR